MKRKNQRKPKKDFGWWATIRKRWTNTMPKFFKVILCICAIISGTALAVNTAIIAGGGVTHEWWNDIYPYLLGIPAGAAFVAKFTQTYGKDGQPVDGNKGKKTGDVVNGQDDS